MMKLYQEHSNIEFVNHYFGELSGYFTVKIWFLDNICLYAALPPEQIYGPNAGQLQSSLQYLAAEFIANSYYLTNILITPLQHTLFGFALDKASIVIN